ncbi:type II toxin-antitoxin system RelE/ParE family toxin [Flagellimonas maritima]|nr:type II toxin-antitoxin system RelE/ParE family toxin [Allomuricauda aurantiaca]
MLSFQLTTTAESDIASIADYTIFKFGIGQARKYRDGLIDSFDQLASNPLLGRTFIMENQPGLKRFRYKSHVIFYRETNSGILIIRILGGMMNFERHL